MVKKRGVSKKLIIISCLGAMMFLSKPVLPAYGSTQPDDIEVEEIEVETVEETSYLLPLTCSDPK